jgi:hypothetical protein
MSGLSQIFDHNPPTQQLLRYPSILLPSFPPRHRPKHPSCASPQSIAHPQRPTARNLKASASFPLTQTQWTWASDWSCTHPLQAVWKRQPEIWCRCEPAQPYQKAGAREDQVSAWSTSGGSPESPRKGDRKCWRIPKGSWSKSETTWEHAIVR